jgi:hypothetical protein
MIFWQISASPMPRSTLNFDAVRKIGLALPGVGVFLLLASRNPSAHRSLIAFAAWSSFAHATVMSVQAYLNSIARRELIGSAVFILIGVALIRSPSSYHAYLSY